MLKKVFRTKANPPTGQSEITGRCMCFSIFFWGISCVIGTGIYFAPLTSVQQAGSASILALIVGGILCLSVAFPFAELSTRIQGFAYEYIYATSGEFLALLNSLGAVLVNIFASAIAAQTWAMCVVQLIGKDINIAYFSFIPILLINMLVLTGRKSSTLVSNIATIINLTNGVLVSVLLWTKEGFTFPKEKLFYDIWDVDQAKKAFPVWFYALLGFENVGALARNVKNSGKIVPLSMIGPVFIALGLNLVLTVGILGQQALPAQDSVLNLLSHSVLHRVIVGGALFGVTAALLWFSLLQGEIMRALSSDGLVPALLNRRSTAGVPYVSVIIHAALCLLCCYLGTINVLVSTLGWTIVGMPMGCLGLLFLRYDDARNPVQLATLKRYSLMLAGFFIGLGILSSWPGLPVVNTWTFRGLAAAAALGGLSWWCRRAKSDCAASPVPCPGFPYVPIFGAISFFFVVGYTLNPVSFGTVFCIAALTYSCYSAKHSNLNDLQEIERRTPVPDH